MFCCCFLALCLSVMLNQFYVLTAEVKVKSKVPYWDGAGDTGIDDSQGNEGLQQVNPRAFLEPAGTLLQG